VASLVAWLPLLSLGLRGLLFLFWGVAKAGGNHVTIGGQKISGGWSLDIQRIKIAGENGEKKTKTVKKGGEKMEINTKANA
jgi:hypothetical protein